MYKLQENGILLISKGTYIPEDIGNRDWCKYQSWLAEGNTPEPYKTAEDKKEESAVEYIGKRLEEYPQLGEQLDMLYKDMTEGTTRWVATIAAIKAKYPKPQSTEE